MLLREAEPGDGAAVYEVCRLSDAGWREGRDPDLLGHVYAGPYLAACRELATVAVDAEGIAGYVLGCADTRAFEAWCEASWWPALRERYPRGSGAGDDAALVELVHDPAPAPADVVAAHPAHLHIDLLPRAIGTGAGRRLMERLLGGLVDRGAPGVHLGVDPANAHAIGFYEHLGFATVREDAGTRWMARSLS